MKKLLLPFITILLLSVSACGKTETFNPAGQISETKTQDQVQNDVLTPTITPAEPAATGGADNPAPTKKADGTEGNEKKNENDEDKYKTGKYTGLAVQGVASGMLTPVFWTELYHGADEIVMTFDEIQRYNEKNFESLPFLNDFKSLPETVKSREVLNWINELGVVPKSARYDENGNKYQQKDYDSLKANLNTGGLAETVNVKYGLTVKRTQMRTFPTFRQSFSSASGGNDYFTETAVYAAEPVLVYHTSTDGQWYFAEMYNYKGWIPVQDVALCSKEDIISRRSFRDYLVVKVPVLFTPDSGDKRVSRLQLDMGVALPVLSENSSGYAVEYPVCDENNNLKLVQLTIPYSGSASAGYLNYTVENVLIQAFRFLGEPYGWGGMNNARDCSAFVADVYRSFGIIFPRNTDQQEKMKGTVSFSGKSRKERLEILDSLRPGTPLYMPGHAMIYLGRWQDRHYIIHDVPTVYQKNGDGKLTAVRLNQVSVTPLDVCNSKGSEYLMLLTTAVLFE